LRAIWRKINGCPRLTGAANTKRRGPNFNLTARRVQSRTLACLVVGLDVNMRDLFPPQPVFFLGQSEKELPLRQLLLLSSADPYSPVNRALFNVRELVFAGMLRL
jgi:hypothetical protein